MIEWALSLWLKLLHCCSLWFYDLNSIINLSFNFSPSLQPEFPEGRRRERISVQSLQTSCHNKNHRYSQANQPIPPQRRSPTLWGGDLSSPDALGVGDLSFESNKIIL